MTIISISCKVSATPTSGHDYWFHQNQFAGFQEAWGSAQLIGAKSQGGPHIQGLLHYGWKERCVSSFWFFRHLVTDAKTIRRKVFVPNLAQGSVIHIYEGGFRELALVAVLSLISVDAKIVFNANLTDPWHLALNHPKNPMSAIAIAGVRKILSALSNRIIFLTETEILRRLFEDNRIVPNGTYPLFASVNEVVPVRKLRKIDAAMFPNGSAEVKLCLTLAKLSSEKSPIFKPKMVIIPRWGYRLSAEDEAEFSTMGIPIIEGTLESADYERLYLDTKVCIFPYIDDYYKISSSGRVLDAMALGARAYAPYSSSASGTIANHNGGGGFDPSDLGALAEILTGEIRVQHATPMRPINAFESAKILREMVTEMVNPHPLPYLERLKIIVGLISFSFINLGLGARQSLGRFLDSTKITRLIGNGLKSLRTRSKGGRL